MSSKTKHVLLDACIITMSLAAGILLARSSFVEQTSQIFYGFVYLASFIAGLFFTSVFTTAPAMVILGELALNNSVFPVAAFGALGAMIGDLIIFYFVRSHASADLEYIVKSIKWRERFWFFRGRLFKLKFLRFILPVAGALVIASPLPDEIGIAMLGLSKLKTSVVMLLSYSFNYLGVLLVGLAARAITG